MQVQEIHRGRLIDHIHLVVSDLERSKRFYTAVLAALGRSLDAESPDYFWADELFVSTPSSRQAEGTPTRRVHLAFQAADRAQVEAFYHAGLAARGTDHGGPGLRPYHPDYYAAFVLDPDGNNIEAVYHGPAERSADAIKITF